MNIYLVTDRHFDKKATAKSSVSKITGLLIDSLEEEYNLKVSILKPSEFKGKNRLHRLVNRFVGFFPFHLKRVPLDATVIFMSETVVSLGALVSCKRKYLILHGAELIAYPELNSKSRKSIDERFSRFLVRAFAQQFRNIFFVSSWARDIWCIRYKFPKERCHLIGNPIHHTKLDVPKNKKRVIVYVGNAKAQKNLHRLCEAFIMSGLKKLGYELRVIGSGHVDLLSRFASEITFLGHLPEENLCNQYAEAEILCFPSLVESFGMPALEGLAAGCKVVTSDRGAIPEITTGLAIFCDPYSVKSISEALKIAVNSEVAPAELRQRVLDPYRPENYAARLLAKIGDN